jgi:hypothetical protein
MEDKYFVNNFCTIPDFIWKDTSLNNSQKCFLGRVFSLQWNETGWCYAGNDTLGREVGIKTRNLTKFISSLVNLGYLERKVTYEENSQKVKERLLRVVTPTPSIGVGVLVSKSAGAGLQTGRVLVSERGGAGLKASYRVDNRIDNRIDLDIANSQQFLDNFQISTKDKKTKPYNSKEFLTNIDKETIAEMVSKFNCTEKNVIDKGEDLLDYVERKGKKYSDYKALLRGAIKKDYGKRLSDRELKQKELEEIRKEYPGLEIVGGGYDDL